ncbi:Uncharacterised protein [Vibrio cholerae]|nr:Uncharacterised protein [Vibrio cholerae]CSC87356.1 Uncharacterised protein [Vibrio cholerae]CSI30124.1 Uncharacterised protein [Vibrio cholerae]
MTSAPNCCAKLKARSRVRFATIIRLQWCPAKCFATSSMVSPAPTNSTVASASDSKMCFAKVQAA